MCLIVVTAGPPHRLVVAANRDEQHARPSAPAAWWPEHEGLLGGRDLRAGGTWLAVDRRGRFAAVTNIRDREPRDGLRSRGALVTEFVAAAEPAERYATYVYRDGARFAAFNLVLYDGRELWLASNRAPPMALGSALHSFSNAPVGVDWPKSASARAGAAQLLGRPSLVDSLFALLAQRDDSPSPERRYEGSHFIVGATYGTRCSTVLLIDAFGRATFAERTFDAGGRQVGEVREEFDVARGR